MNPGTGFGIAPRRGGGFGQTALFVHHTGPDALAWATFALVLLLVLTVFALVIARSQRRRGFGGPGHRRRRFAFAGPGGPGMGPGRGMGPGAEPLEVLRWRYARGEIGRDEFLLATSDLTAHSEPAPPPPPS
jgi:hypothetical protein